MSDARINLLKGLLTSRACERTFAPVSDNTRNDKANAGKFDFRSLEVSIIAFKVFFRVLMVVPREFGLRLSPFSPSTGNRMRCIQNYCGGFSRLASQPYLR